MGRKRVSWKKRRRPITVSLPLDVILFLDDLVDSTNGSRSKYIEGLVREQMRNKNQSRLILEAHVYSCDSKKGCGRVFIRKGPIDQFALCRCYELATHVKEYLGEEE